MKCRILIVHNAEWDFLAYRLSLGLALQQEGWEVLVSAPVERNQNRAIEEAGFRFVPLTLKRGSLNPVNELGALLELYRLYRIVKPDIVHHMTVKPVVYGSMVARALGIRGVINTIPGLGYSFSGRGVRWAGVRLGLTSAYRVALHDPRFRVIFENDKDREFFVKRGLALPEQCRTIKGQGVDVQKFIPQPEPPGVPIVLYASRIIWDKGVGELVGASRILKQRKVPARVVLVGTPDKGSRNHIPLEALERWRQDGVVEWWGQQDDMPSVLRQSAIVVLPTYYPEGLPRILLEAAAVGRAIVGTDTGGCSDIIRNGENGIIVSPRDEVGLADALGILLRDRETRQRMGAAGRRIVLEEFSEAQVVRRTLEVYREVMHFVRVER